MHINKERIYADKLMHVAQCFCHVILLCSMDRYLVEHLIDVYYNLDTF